jgi:uncharacterized Ntn-hydrolase superfamily protein
MTFSIVGFDRSTGDLGVACASKFPGIGGVTPFASAGIGAIATQSYINTGFGPRGLELLSEGVASEEVIESLIASDDGRDYRQLGLIDSRGRAASYTGAECFDWCGGVIGEGFCVQGNTLTGRAVVDAAAEAFRAVAGSLAERLLASLAAGQEMGGDRRGQQSAALLVVRAGGGYSGHNDRYVDIPVYDHPTPVAELQRLYAMHRLTYHPSNPASLVTIEGAVAIELQGILTARGFYGGPQNGSFDPVSNRALHDFMGWENYDARMRDDDLIDTEVLEDIRKKHQTWLASQSG